MSRLNPGSTYLLFGGISLVGFVAVGGSMGAIQGGGGVMGRGLSMLISSMQALGAASDCSGKRVHWRVGGNG